MTDLVFSRKTPIPAAFRPLIRLLARVIAILDATPHSLIGLLARVVPSLVFWQSGQTKMDGFTIKDTTYVLFQEEYRIPLIPPHIAAIAAATAEHVFPVLLVIGLASRLSALALLAMTLVIEIFVYPDAYVEHGLWAISFLIIIARGPGTISADYFVRRWYQNRAD
jgi:putative oxidoreductase